MLNLTKELHMKPYGHTKKTCLEQNIYMSRLRQLYGTTDCLPRNSGGVRDSEVAHDPI